MRQMKKHVPWDAAHPDMPLGLLVGRQVKGGGIQNRCKLPSTAEIHCTHSWHWPALREDALLARVKTWSWISVLVPGQATAQNG
eukprot:782800-Pelagomonas_calceolata.AAC.6